MIFVFLAVLRVPEASSVHVYSQLISPSKVQFRNKIRDFGPDFRGLGLGFGCLDLDFEATLTFGRLPRHVGGCLDMSGATPTCRRATLTCWEATLTCRGLP